MTRFMHDFAVEVNRKELKNLIENNKFKRGKVSLSFTDRSLYVSDLHYSSSSTLITEDVKGKLPYTLFSGFSGLLHIEVEENNILEVLNKTTDELIQLYFCIYNEEIMVADKTYEQIIDCEVTF